MQMIFFWKKEFFNGRESVEDELRSGRSFSSIQNKFFCNSMFHRVKLLIDTITLQFWKVYESGFGKKDHIRGAISGGCIMTMRQRILTSK
jgi:hypothetical protein